MRLFRVQINSVPRICSLNSGLDQSAKLAMVKAREELELKIPLLDKVDINSIVNLTALVFLEEWLENDQNATQTMSLFLLLPIHPKK